MKNITEEIPEFKVFEKAIYKIMCQVSRDLIAEYLLMWDRIVLAQRDTEEYRMVNTGMRTIKTVMGEVSYTRRCYKRKAGGHVFLLDEVLGLDNGCGLISENLMEQIVIESSEKSFRKAAASINSLTGQRVSAMGAWNVVKGYGAKLTKQEERLEELDRAGVTGQLGNKPCEALFEELDGVWINRQRETRRKKGDATTKGRKRIGHKPMCIGTAYTGWKQAKDGGYETVDKFAYASFDDAEKFGATFEALLRQRFDMDGVKSLVMNGDGDGWIKTAAERNDAILQLDPYHRSQAILRAVSDARDRKRIYDAIREKDTEKVVGVISDLIATKTEEAELKRLGKLLAYFHSNKESLLTWRERGINLPTPPKGVSYRDLGTQESSNCNLLTLRMKHRKGSWTENGANHMAKILCYRHTVGLDTMLGVLPQVSTDKLIVEPLSAGRTPLTDGKGDGAEWLHADMPFDQVFRTNGREAIKGLLSQRRLCELSFI
jgi:hypothetical protein